MDVVFINFLKSLLRTFSNVIEPKTIFFYLFVHANIRTDLNAVFTIGFKLYLTYSVYLISIDSEIKKLCQYKELHATTL